MRNKEAAAMQSLRDRRKAEGVCIYCGEGPLETKVMCGGCAKKKRSSEAPLKFVQKKRYPIHRKSKLVGKKETDSG